MYSMQQISVYLLINYSVEDGQGTYLKDQGKAILAVYLTADPFYIAIVQEHTAIVVVQISNTIYFFEIMHKKYFIH